MAPFGRTASFAGALALLVVAPPLSGQDGPETEGEFLFSGVSFPSVAGDFRVTQAMRWAEADAGVQLSYTPEGIAGAYNVYVYPAQGDLERETAIALQGMVMSANRAREQVTIDSTRTVTVAGFDGELAITSVVRGDRVVRSLVYVFLKGSSAIKYRLTYDPPMREVLNDPISDFLHVTLSLISSPWQ
jgi:hypothetical protein